MKKLLVCLFMLLPFTAIMGQQVSHTVQRGETLESIAKKYNVSVYALQQANPGSKDLIYTGMKLVIPNSKEKNKETKKKTQEQIIVNNPTYNENLVKNVETQPKTDNNQKKSGFTDGLDGMIDAQDFTIMLKPDIDVYGFRFTTTNYKLIGMTFGGTYQFVSHGSSDFYLGLGLAPRYTVGPLLFGVSLYPYVNMYSQYVQDGEYKSGTPKFKDKIKVGYGGILDIMAGFKVYTTKKGKDIYVTGSYHVNAFEFKTEGAFKNGLWGVGIAYNI